jgi:mandelate racemase
VRADDFPGCARVATAVRTPIQLGENFAGPLEVHAAASAGAADLLMADAQQIGGATGWLRASAVAHGCGRELSSHLFREVSAHLLAVSPTADRLEYMPVADPRAPRAAGARGRDGDRAGSPGDRPGAGRGRGSTLRGRVSRAARGGGRPREAQDGRRAERGPPGRPARHRLPSGSSVYS